MVYYENHILVPPLYVTVLESLTLTGTIFSCSEDLFHYLTGLRFPLSYCCRQQFLLLCSISLKQRMEFCFIRCILCSLIVWDHYHCYKQNDDRVTAQSNSHTFGPSGLWCIVIYFPGKHYHKAVFPSYSYKSELNI